MKVAVVGSRNLTNEDFINSEVGEYLRLMHDTYGTTLPLVFLYGGSKGAANVAIDSLKKHGYDTILFKPWHMIDRKLPFSTNLFFMRNKQMIDNADRVIVLCNNERDAEVDRAVSYAKKVGKHVFEIRFTGGSDATEAA
jgi:hypothetical protein